MELKEKGCSSWTRAKATREAPVEKLTCEGVVKSEIHSELANASNRVRKDVVHLEDSTEKLGG